MTLDELIEALTAAKTGPAASVSVTTCCDEDNPIDGVRISPDGLVVTITAFDRKD